MKRIGLYPRVGVDTNGVGVVPQGGGVALVGTARASGLDRALSMALAPWRRPMAVHDPGKMITDLAIALALGGDCLADIALLRAEPAVFELRHRRRARCEDRIRIAKDTGLRNLPLHAFAQNQIWCAIVALAVELAAWMQMLTLAGHDARRWEPKRLRLRLFSIAARLADHDRTRRLHLSAHAPWSSLLAKMINDLQAIPAPG